MVIVVYPLEGFTVLAAPFVAIKCRVSGRQSPRTSLLGTRPGKAANGKRQWYSSGSLSQEKPLPESERIFLSIVSIGDQSAYSQIKRVFEEISLIARSLLMRPYRGTFVIIVPLSCSL